MEDNTKSAVDLIQEFLENDQDTEFVPTKFKLNRDIPKSECDWLPRDFKKDEIIFEYTGYTYGCCSRTGTACTILANETPFLEFPNDALEKV
jgi:hypothetical protein